MRHVPGFDQGWRGFNDGKDECPLTPALFRSGERERTVKDTGSSIKDVEDDRFLPGIEFFLKSV